MNSCISIYSIESAANLEGLASLPKHVPWRLFKSQQHGRLFLDQGFNQKNEWEKAEFSHSPNFCDGKVWQLAFQKFDKSHAFLNRMARDGAMAEQMNLYLIHFAFFISKLIQGRIFCTMKDDDGHDCVVEVENSKLCKLTFSNGDDIVTVDANGLITTKPNHHWSEDCKIIGGVAFEQSLAALGYILPLPEEFDTWPKAPSDTYELVASHQLVKTQSFQVMFAIGQWVRKILKK
jgi:hypothetical protein